MLMIGLDVAMYTFFKVRLRLALTLTLTLTHTLTLTLTLTLTQHLMLLVYAFDAAQRWWRGGSIRRRWRLRRRLHGVVSWGVYYKAAHELDSLDGKDAPLLTLTRA